MHCEKLQSNILKSDGSYHLVYSQLSNMRIQGKIETYYEVQFLLLKITMNNNYNPLTPSPPWKKHDFTKICARFRYPISLSDE